MSFVFVADSFRKSFAGKPVLKAASAWAAAGRITVVLGRNGSGKTTLIRCALGMRWREQGVVRFKGEAYPRPRLWKLAREGLFYLPDRGLLSRRATVRQHLALQTSRFGENGDPDAAFEQLEVAHLMDRYAKQLSGGECRRAEIALAMARRPECLIADEPLGEIEPKDRSLVADAIRSLARRGTAVIVTGHEVHDLLELADEVIWMAAGTTHGLGAPDDARAHDQFRREYLGPNF